MKTASNFHHCAAKRVGGVCDQPDFWMIASLSVPHSDGVNAQRKLRSPAPWTFGYVYCAPRSICAFELQPMNRWYLRLFAVAILPLLGFWMERGLDEPFAGPALFMLYAVGLMAFALTLTGWLAPPALSVAAGVLGTGSLLAGAIAAFGTVAATILLAMVPMSFFFGPSRGSHDYVRGIAASVMIAAIMVSPWVTSVSLAQLTRRSMRSSREQIGARLTAICAILGATLTAAAMMVAVRADTGWLAPRLQAFNTDDVASWEKSLSDIKGRWLCGHRRCLMPVCDKLMGRFGRTAGISGPFVSPFGLGLEAPKVPPELALPFTRIYGHPVAHVCAVGD